VFVGASLEDNCCCTIVSTGIFYFSVKIWKTKQTSWGENFVSQHGKGCHAVLEFNWAPSSQWWP